MGAKPNVCVISPVACDIDDHSSRLDELLLELYVIWKSVDDGAGNVPDFNVDAVGGVPLGGEVDEVVEAVGELQNK